MKYSQELMAEMMRLYPDATQMHECATSGNIMLGRWLDDSSSSGIPNTDILSATSLEELQERAQAIEDKRNLYRMWGSEYQAQQNLGQEM